MGTFPILSRGRNVGTVPLAYVVNFRRQIERNHNQTIERLAERGGLSWMELYVAIMGVRGQSKDFTEDNGRRAELWILRNIAAWVKEQ